MANERVTRSSIVGELIDAIDLPDWEPRRTDPTGRMRAIVLTDAQSDKLDEIVRRRLQLAIVEPVAGQAA